MDPIGKIQLWRERIEKDFERIAEIQEHSYKPGDLLLRETDYGAYHAGVYCGNNEVIDFTGSERKMQSVLKSDVHEFGTVSKKSLKHFKCGKSVEVYRLRAKEKFPKSFPKNVQEAMDKFVKYHVLKFNCLHFALCVLEVLDWQDEKFSATTGTNSHASDGYEAISMDYVKEECQV